MLLNPHLCSAGLIATFMIAAAASTSAAPLDDDFETYTVGNALASENSNYTSSATITQNLADLVNATKTARQTSEPAGPGGTPAATSSSTSIATGPFTEDVNFSIDLFFEDSPGISQFYLFNNDFSARPVWIQFNHDTLATTVKHDGINQSIGNFALNTWYRLNGTVHVDTINGANTTFDATLTRLSDNTSTSIAGLNSFGDPADVSRSQITSGFGADITFDNWQVTAVPEPGILGLMAMGTLLITGRKRSV